MKIGAFHMSPTTYNGNFLENGYRDYISVIYNNYNIYNKYA
jgi:hypothetical protein